MNLTIDIGNSAAKGALFDEGVIVEKIIIRNSEFIIPPHVDGAIIVSTRGEETEMERHVRESVGRFIKFDHTTPVPVKNLYATPETLGYDRLAAAVGAHTLFPGETALVCDFGTAITYDIVTAAGEYLGGNISPGAGSRFRALHDYTGTLPLCTLPKNLAEPPRPLCTLPKNLVEPPRPLCGHPSTGGEFPTRELPGFPIQGGGGRNFSSFRKEEYPEPKASGEVVGYFPARDTKTAIENGVVAGIVAETEACIEAAKKNFHEIKIIFTGGDADYFAERVNYPIFATSDLVFYGLNAILEYNGANRTGDLII